MQNANLALGFVAIARPTFDVELAEDMTAQVYRQLNQAGFSLAGSPALVMDLEAMDRAVQSLSPGPLDLLVVLQASFADSTMVLYLAETVDAPLLLWAMPEERIGGRLRLNSFCGINLAAHSLRRAGYDYDYVVAPPGDAVAMEKARVLATASALKRRLQTARIGRVGDNPAGFETCLVDRAALKRRLGLEIIQVDLDDVFADARAVNPQAATAVADRVKAKVVGIDELDQNATDGTLRAYVALNQIADRLQLDGLAVRCWPEFFTDLGCAACGAMSLLSDEMKPCSCEVDVNGTITQLILQWLSGEPAFGSDLVAFDLEEDVAILWHCGLAPLSMADPDVQPKGIVHSNRQMPLLLQFPLKPGRVTLARLSESTGEFRLVVGGGEMVKAPPGFTGTSGTLRFDRGAAAVMDTILQEGLEHHLALTYGNHIPALLALGHRLNMPILHL